MMDLPPSGRRAMHARLLEIATAPFATHANVTAMKGERDLFRLRQGGWHALYQVDREAAEVRVLVIDTRSEVYR
jgi:mRNA-degrading endonuclease RelE of RelBE toxin-antitoxin system